MPYANIDKQREYQRRWRADRRIDWLTQHGPCERCGSWCSLEIHHTDQSTKVSHGVWSWTKERMEAELAKCEVLCYLCHKEETRKQLLKDIQHGKRSGYNRGCRCDPCKAAEAAYKKHYRC